MAIEHLVIIPFLYVIFLSFRESYSALKSFISNEKTLVVVISSIFLLNLAFTYHYSFFSWLTFGKSLLKVPLLLCIIFAFNFSARSDLLQLKFIRLNKVVLYGIIGSVFISAACMKYLGIPLFNVHTYNDYIRFAGIVCEPSHLVYSCGFLLYTQSLFLSPSERKISVEGLAFIICGLLLSKTLALLIFIAILLFLLFSQRIKISWSPRSFLIIMVLALLTSNLTKISLRKGESEGFMNYASERVRKIEKGKDNSFMNRFAGSLEVLTVASPSQLVWGLGAGQASNFVKEKYSDFRSRKNNDYQIHIGFLNLFYSYGVVFLFPFLMLVRITAIVDLACFAFLSLCFGGYLFFPFFFLALHLVDGGKLKNIFLKLKKVYDEAGSKGTGT